MIHQPHSSPHEASLKCEHGTYKPTSLVSPRKSNWIWTSPLISSHVNHDPWTYPLMAQHLPIQVYYRCVKTSHKQTMDSSVIAWRSISVAKRNLPRPYGGTILTARHQVSSKPLYEGLSPSGSYLTVRHCAVQEHPWRFYRLAHLLVPPGAIIVAYSYWFLAPKHIKTYVRMYTQVCRYVPFNLGELPSNTVLLYGVRTHASESSNFSIQNL